jgi:hypothetical protein
MATVDVPQSTARSAPAVLDKEIDEQLRAVVELLSDDDDSSKKPSATSTAST